MVESRSDIMKKMRSLTRTLLTILFFMSVSVAVSSCRDEKEDPSTVCYEKLRHVNKLMLGRMSLSKMASISDLPFEEASTLNDKLAAITNKLKIGSRTAVYGYNTYLTAYLDLSRLSPDDINVDETSKSIRITLPPIDIEVTGRDPELHELHYRVTGLRSDITPQERATTKESMSNYLKRELSGNSEFNNRLKAEAESNARRYFTNFAKARGYHAEITFK